MAALLSTVSGKFSQSLILGTFFPVVIFLTLASLFIWPFFAGLWPVHKQPAIFAGDVKDAIALTLAALVVSNLLYSLNGPLIRLYEGYPWKKGLLGRWWTQRFTNDYVRQVALQQGIFTLLCYGPFQNDARYATIVSYWNELSYRLTRIFPGNSGLIMPTRLGNVIRSFEYYPDRQYQIEAISIWPRLVGKIDKDFAAVIDDAKSTFDFALNMSFLLGVLTLGIVVGGLLAPRHFPSQDLLFWIAEVVVFAVLAYGFYRLSIPRAMSWGSTVKSAFDLYRLDLLKQLGFTQAPATPDEERALWDEVSDRLTYGPRPEFPPSPYTDPSPTFPTITVTTPEGATVALTRGVLAKVNGGTLTVVIHVDITSPANDPITAVTIADRMPDGFEYVWDSASVGGGSVAVTGTNPYHFLVSPPSDARQFNLTYRMQSRTLRISALCEGD